MSQILEGDPYQLGFTGYTEEEAQAMLKGQQPAYGLGDVVAWALYKVGIKPFPGCGCEERKRQLNRIRLFNLGKR